MKKIQLITLAMFFCLITFGQKNNLNLKAFIDSLFNVDQQVQIDFMEVLLKKASKDSIKLFNNRKEETFKKHIPIIKYIIEQHGYPTFEKVGEECSKHFFVLVQHSDVDVAFQSKMLKVVKQQVDKKQVSGSDYAFLYDRVQINSGKQQLYGTQLNYDTNYNAIAKNLKDPKLANTKRKELGLETLEAYLQWATEVHKKHNKKN